MKQQQMLSAMSDQRESSVSNYSPNQLSIESRLSAKQFLAKQQNAIHEIELKHQHLDDKNEQKPADKLMELNENQLAYTSSNSNFPSTFNLDTSSSMEIVKHSSGQQQISHFDDQLEQKKNELLDEVNEKLSKNEQQGLLHALHRVKRRDIINMDLINQLITKQNLVNGAIELCFTSWFDNLIFFPLSFFSWRERDF